MLAILGMLFLRREFKSNAVTPGDRYVGVSLRRQEK
jgi:hypothetical protein